MLGAAMMIGAAAFTASAARADVVCKVPADMLRLSAPFKAARAVMASEAVIRVIALGSSSTQGTGASSPKMCYPAQLESALNRRFAGTKRFEVTNLGVGGQLVNHMVARLDRDVLPLQPHLVIWQTGVNDAIDAMPVEDFRMFLSQGIDAILSSGADVILLDSQYYPKAARVPGFMNYLTTMREVAREKGVSLLSRFQIMKHLVTSAQFTTAQLLSPDQFHLNDLSYGCLGGLMADAIGDGLELAQGRVPATSASAKSAALR